MDRAGTVDPCRAPFLILPNDVNFLPAIKRQLPLSLTAQGTQRYLRSFSFYQLAGLLEGLRGNHVSPFDIIRQGQSNDLHENRKGKVHFDETPAGLGAAR